ncbi:unnamed protein product [Paramecium primaurelia]|uniref:PH domain-containing protein n=1 Tax=Paramecium primaurelia TaxID=5886 RepID=A0A8S1KTJ8_PARPR|nr:unnamed protein product [Paramecium primaurelia]
MESFLEKKSPVLIKGWQKRYFVYCENLLLYFKNKVDLPPYQPKGVIMKQNIVQVDYLDPNKNEFVIHVGLRKFQLRAESKEIKEKWLDILKVPFNQTSKTKSELSNMNKVKWLEIPEQTIIQLYLRREEILQNVIQQKTQDTQNSLIKSSYIQQTIVAMGEKNKEFILRLLVEKKSVKNPQVKKKRWLLLFTSISTESLDQIHQFIKFIPQQYTLDTINLLKYDNNLATLTKTTIEIYQIQNLQFVVTNEYQIMFMYNGRVFELIFPYLSDAKKLNDYIVKCQQINNSMPVQVSRTNQIPVYKMQDSRRRIINLKGKTFLENQVEKKINASQWKNVILTLKEHALFWEFVDTEEYSNIELKSISAIEQCNRMFTIIVNDQNTVQQQFRVSTIQEADEWTGQLSYMTDIEITIKVLEKSQTLQNYQQNALTNQSQTQQLNKQKTQQQQEEQKKPSFFQQLFCWGGERKEQ